MSLQSTLDRTAIGLSSLCALHCFLLPVTMVFVSVFVPITLDDEAFHQWLLMGTLPVSLIALTMGCHKHKRYRVYFYGVLGLLILGLASYLGHQHLGEFGERALTLLGGVIVALGHVSNHRLCRRRECECSSIEELESAVLVN